MPPEFISQEDLRRARELQDALDDEMARLAARVAEGALVEPGELAILGSRVVWREVKLGFDRFQLFRRLLDVKDVRFFGSDRQVAADFRRARARIFLEELGRLRGAIDHTFRRRRDRIANAGKWSAYGTLLRETAAAYAALAVLQMHARLFVWKVPFQIGLESSGKLVFRYVNAGSPALGSRA